MAALTAPRNKGGRRRVTFDETIEVSKGPKRRAKGVIKYA
jgi:hypothetical protein